MLRSFTLLLAVTTLLVGCNRPAYINVPADMQDIAINDPNHRSVIALEQAALAYLLSDSKIPGDIVVLLPEGTRDRAKFALAANLSAYNVYPEGQTPSSEYRVVEVRKVTARGGLARVDVVRPGKYAKREFVEVHMEWALGPGWVPDYIDVRNFKVDDIDPKLLAPPGREPVDPAYEPIEPAAEPVEVEELPAE